MNQTITKNVDTLINGMNPVRSRPPAVVVRVAKISKLETAVDWSHKQTISVNRF